MWCPLPPEKITERSETKSRALPEVPERKSGHAGRRGGLATRAATTPPEAAPEIRQNPAEIPDHLAGRWIKSLSFSASPPSSGNRPSPLRGRIRCGFPVLRIEWPGPWKIIAERGESSRWWSVFEQVRALLVPEAPQPHAAAFPL